MCASNSLWHRATYFFPIRDRFDFSLCGINSRSYIISVVVKKYWKGQRKKKLRPVTPIPSKDLVYFSQLQLKYLDKSRDRAWYLHAMSKQWKKNQRKVRWFNSNQKLKVALYSIDVGENAENLRSSPVITSTSPIHVINRVICSVHLNVYSSFISMLCHGFIYALVCKHIVKNNTKITQHTKKMTTNRYSLNLSLNVWNLAILLLDISLRRVFSRFLG